MANQYSNNSLGELVRVQGEQLARLTVIVDRHDDDLHEQKESIDLIAKAVARRETRDEFWTKILIFGLPIATTLVGAFASHFLFH